MSKIPTHNIPVPQDRDAPLEGSGKKQPRSSAVAENLSMADRTGRGRDYNVTVTSHEYDRVQTGDGDGQVRIIASQYTDAQADPERDRRDAIAAAEQANFRSLSNGGDTQQEAAKRTPLSDKTSIAVNDATKQGDAGKDIDALRLGLLRSRRLV
jgi:hypothetical protein